MVENAFIVIEIIKQFFVINKAEDIYQQQLITH